MTHGVTALAHDSEARRIVILGGGFGGVDAALALEKLFLREDTKVRVAGDWTLDLFFPRDVVPLKLFTTSADHETALDAPEAAVAVAAPASQ